MYDDGRTLDIGGMGHIKDASHGMRSEHMHGSIEETCICTIYERSASDLGHRRDQDRFPAIDFSSQKNTHLR